MNNLINGVPKAASDRMATGMAHTPGCILVLNGTSSSGKSSLLRALQQVLEAPYLEAGLDKFLWMLPKRYLEPPLWGTVLGQATQAGPTGHHLVAGMHRAIAALAHAGHNVLADHVLVEPVWVQDAATLFQDLPAYLVQVDCQLEILVAREQLRRDRTWGQAASQYPLVHAHGIYDFTVDTGQNPPEACAIQIKSWLDTNPPPTAWKTLAAEPR